MPDEWAGQPVEVVLGLGYGGHPGFGAEAMVWDGDRPVQGINNTYGAAWLRPTSLLTGRLLKFGAQVDW